MSKEAPTSSASDTQADEAHFKELIIAWFALDDKIKEIGDTLKELRSEKAQVEQAVIDHMEREKEEVVQTTKGNLIMTKRESKSSITPDLISQLLAKRLQNEQLAADITSEILDGRAVKAKVGIKRQMIRRTRKTLTANA